MSARAGERAALKILCRVMDKNEHFGDAQREELKGLPDGAARAATAYARLTVENWIFLNTVLSRYTDLKRAKPMLRNIVRLGAARCLFGNDGPAAVNGSVELAREQGFAKQAGFVNAVLRNLLRGKEEILSKEPTDLQQLAVRASWPTFLLEEAQIVLGSFSQVQELVFSPTPMPLVRVNPRRTTAQQAIMVLAEEGVEAKQDAMDGMLSIKYQRDTATTAAYRRGWITPMGKASRVVCGFVPSCAKLVIDTCAAPGGKTCAIAEQLADGQVIALDADAQRAAAIERQRERLGLENIAVCVHNGTVAKDEYLEMADVVLVDAPCSGLGTFLRKPEGKYRRSFQDIQRLAELQKTILTQASKYVKSGGILIYSTCTFTRQENEWVTKSFLAKQADFAPTQLDNPFLGNNLNRYQNGELRLWSHLDETDCFYMRTMVRK